MFSLQNKIAIVTGGGSGIGRAIAKRLAAAGATVHIIDMDESAGNESVNEIKADSGNAFSHVASISDQPSIQALFASIGDIHILVNNAGIAHIGNIEKTSDEDLTRVFNVNVRGVFTCSQTVVPIMRSRGGGVILNISSVAAHVGILDRFAYSMSKGAVHAMGLSIARDYLSAGIRCNTISPARVHTPFVDGFLKKAYPGQEEEMFQKLAKTQPIGRMGTPEEVSALALFLCSDEAAFITGCDYPIDGGFLKLNN